jgi:hypothetical protein
MGGDDGLLRVIQKSDQSTWWTAASLPPLPTTSSVTSSIAASASASASSHSSNDYKDKDSKAKPSRGTSFFSLLTRDSTPSATTGVATSASSSTTMLSSTGGTTSSSSSSSSIQLTLNHSLTYHDNYSVMHVTWNDNMDKLLSFDSRGRIIVSALIPPSNAPHLQQTGITASSSSSSSSGGGGGAGPSSTSIPISPISSTVDRTSYSSSNGSPGGSVVSTSVTPSHSSSLVGPNGSGGGGGVAHSAALSPTSPLFIEEMRSERTSSMILGVAWSSNGQRVAMVYDDGVVIVGRADERLWAKQIGIRDPALQKNNNNNTLTMTSRDLKSPSAPPSSAADGNGRHAERRKQMVWNGVIEWSIDHLRLYVATKSGEVVILDASDGSIIASVNFLPSLPLLISLPLFIIHPIDLIIS